MATSLEMRVPYLDNEVVKVVEKIPAEYKIKKNQQKYILKKVAEKYLPREIIYRPKRGFVLPILKWLQEDLNEKLYITLVEEKAMIHEFIDKNFLKDLILRYKKKEETDHRKLYIIWQFELFLRRFTEFIYG